MLELVLLAVVLYAICSAVFGSAGRKDEKRRPCFILEERNYLRVCLKTVKTPSWSIFFRQDCVDLT